MFVLNYCCDTWRMCGCVLRNQILTRDYMVTSVQTAGETPRSNIVWLGWGKSLQSNRANNYLAMPHWLFPVTSTHYSTTRLERNTSVITDWSRSSSSSPDSKGPTALAKWNRSAPLAHGGLSGSRENCTTGWWADAWLLLPTGCCNNRVPPSVSNCLQSLHFALSSAVIVKSFRLQPGNVLTWEIKTGWGLGLPCFVVLFKLDWKFVIKKSIPPVSQKSDNKKMYV